MISRGISKLPGRWIALYDKMYERNPYTTAAGTMAAKSGGCDVVAQLLQDQTCDIDYKRTAKFSFFCTFYAGCFQHAVFNVLYSRLFPGKGFTVAIQKTAMDNFIHSPFVYLPTFYVYKSVTDGRSCFDGLFEYRYCGAEVLKSCWALWIPAQFLAFYAVPPNFRILYNATVGCVWEVILSYLLPLKDEFPKNGRKENDPT